MSLTKDQICKDALLKLKAGGARVRKVHNVSAYKKRRGQVEPGWTDIQGYSSQGLIVLCEVKTENDRLSKEQIERLKDCAGCGGMAMIAYEKAGTTQIELFKDSIYYAVHYIENKEKV